MTTLLETERMVLRRLTPDDEDDVVALHSDPAVMRFLGPPQTRAQVRERLPEMTGGAVLTALEKATGAFLGWFLLLPTDTPGTVELGYRLHVAAWGRGLATEGAAALVDRAFADPAVERVVADTMAVNTGSRNVMEKVGLRFVRTFRYEGSAPLPGNEHGDVEYALTREEWRRGPRPTGPGPGAATPPR